MTIWVLDTDHLSLLERGNTHIQDQMKLDRSFIMSRRIDPGLLTRLLNNPGFTGTN